MAALLDRPGFPEAFAAYVAGVSDMNAKYYKTNFPTLKPDKIESEVGPKYMRVWKVDGSSKSIHTFVDRATGNILKAGTWKAPAKNGVRGNIFDPDFGLSKVDHHGAKYLRG